MSTQSRTIIGATEQVGLPISAPDLSEAVTVRTSLRWRRRDDHTFSLEEFVSGEWVEVPIVYPGKCEDAK